MVSSTIPRSIQSSIIWTLGDAFSQSIFCRSTTSRPPLIKSSFCHGVKYHSKDYQEQYHMDTAWCFFTKYLLQINHRQDHL
ncbi:hypothetical protein BCR43DRAFT_485509 [Syncephalastrum racemosum]|uniref:Uncharacterized protein n=1 Tax=Syncephalastrum racemosum TaxID=13706 RepID=A0A1X2HNZ8_SYNRA|nr:hypothetical protein BCR43DRAFT_485509 [Syncephalastrum racemosum]